MSLAPYVLKGAIKRGLGVFNSISTTGINTTSAVGGITASATQTLAGATGLTAETNVISTVAAAGNAVRLPPLIPGQSVSVFNNGANAMAVFPAAAGVTIDGGAAGASVTLTNAKRARFTCVAANTIVSAQLGAVSA